MKNILAGILAVTLFSNVCFAGAKDRGLWDNVMALKPGQKIQVVQTNLVAVEGKFKSVSEEEIIVVVKTTEVSVKRDDVRRIVVKKGRHIIAGVLIGAAAGLSILASSQEDSYYTALAALPGFVGGGAAVGAAVPSTSVIYQRP